MLGWQMHLQVMTKRAVSPVSVTPERFIMIGGGQTLRGRGEWIFFGGFGLLVVRYLTVLRVCWMVRMICLSEAVILVLHSMHQYIHQSHCSYDVIVQPVKRMAHLTPHSRYETPSSSNCRILAPLARRCNLFLAAS